MISQWSKRQSINEKQLNENERERRKNHKEKMIWRWISDKSDERNEV
jgi:Fe-S cluster biosynthesis and repair protein YggX